MKRSLILILIVGMLTFNLTVINSNATTIYYSDDFANWPGYFINPADELGESPKILGAWITYDENRYLQTIEFQMTNKRTDHTLFINSDWVTGEPYDKWDYVVPTWGYNFANPIPLYSVNSPFNYIFATGGRTGHPASIQGSFIVAPGYFVSIDYDANYLKYTFPAGIISLGDKFVFAMSEDCANDVFVTLVPEPGILMLLGIALSGLGLFARKFRLI